MLIWYMIVLYVVQFFLTMFHFIGIGKGKRCGYGDDQCRDQTGTEDAGEASELVAQPEEKGSKGLSQSEHG